MSALRSGAPATWVDGFGWLTKGRRGTIIAPHDPSVNGIAVYWEGWSNGYPWVRRAIKIKASLKWMKNETNVFVWKPEDVDWSVEQ